MPADFAFDPLRPDHIRDPYPHYARLRERAPIFWDDRLHAWLFTRHRDCVAALRDTRHFAADPRRAGESVPDAAMTIQMLDPPLHTAVHAPLRAACRAQDLAAIAYRARCHADRLVSTLRADGGGDFMAAFALPFAVAATCDFLGVAPPDTALLSSMGDAFMRNMDADLRADPTPPAADARAALAALVDAWLADPPCSGVLHARLQQRAAGEICHRDLLNNLYVMFNAGYLSLFSAIGNAVLALLRNAPDLSTSLDPAALPRAVEELLRYDATAQAMGRVCAADVVFEGARITRGDAVILLLGAANRDPAQFARPDDLILDRQPNRHLALGWGHHACLGATLARALMTVALESLRDRAAGMRLAAEPTHKPQVTLRCLDTLPVSF